MTKKSAKNSAQSICMLMAIMILMLFFTDSYARAGGAGGNKKSSYHSSSWGSSSTHHSSSWGSSSTYHSTHSSKIKSSSDHAEFLSFKKYWWYYASIGGILLLIYPFAKLSENREEKKALANFSRTLKNAKPYGLSSYMRSNPEFKVTDLISKARIAFMQIQDAWSKQNLSGIRRFISDGMYQRFFTQITMMKMLKQTNQLSNIIIQDIKINRIEADGDFDLAHLFIWASMKDVFICEMDHSLDSRCSAKFIECWSFVRKRTAKKVDIYSSIKCPQCGAQLPPELGEISACPYCTALVNSGEYDWVLAEITQIDDEGYRHALYYSGNLLKNVNELRTVLSGFSIQHIEDIASNAFLQILTASVLHRPEMIRRFTSDDLFSKLLRNMKSEGAFLSEYSGGTHIPQKPHKDEEFIIYNRLYLNSVALIGAKYTSNHCSVCIEIIYSFQRIKINNLKITDKIDKEIKTEKRILILEKTGNEKADNGALYVHRCPSCGAPAVDTIDIECTYCKTPLNNPKNQWIVSGLQRKGEKTTWDDWAGKGKEFEISTKKIDSFYSIKDYAINNCMIVLASDGIFDIREEVFITQLAKQWNIPLQNLKPLFEMARSNRLRIRMPDSPDLRKEVFKLMKTAAESDRVISEKEKQILEYIHQTYSIPV